MLRTINELQGFAIQATDGEIGSIKDFYFDEESWAIRYIVVDTGRWLPGRKVLLSPHAMGYVDRDDETLSADLTKAEIEESPPVYVEKPLSQQLEGELHQYYGWPYYWAGRNAATVLPPNMTRKEKNIQLADPQLRSSQAIIGYHIHATDGDIGHVEDFLLDDQEWFIRYMIVDTRNWLPGRKVLVALNWIEKFGFEEQMAQINLTKQKIEASPEYDPDLRVERAYEASLHDYYVRSAYWLAKEPF